MSFASACQHWEAAQRAELQYDTWGHLAPKKNKTYRGHVVWSLGCLGSDYLNPKIMQFDFGPDLTSSPWLYDSLIEMLQGVTERADGNLRQQCRDTEGGLWRWDGTFRNYKWRGIVKRLEYEGMAPRTIEKQGGKRLTRQNFQAIAEEIRALKTCVQRQRKAREVIPDLKRSNPRFDEKRFLIACNA